jgi:hypothetical protein
VRTTVTIDDDVYSEAMQPSRVSGQRLGKILSDLAREVFANCPEASQTALSRL